MLNGNRLSRFGAIASVLGTAWISTGVLAQETYTVDNTHSSAIFRVKHNQVSYFYGRFNEVGGTFKLDATNPDKSVVRIEVKTESIDTNSESRDKHLKSPDFFNAKENPTISFASTEVRKAGENRYEVTGDLILCGVTQIVTIPVEWVGSGTDQRGTKIAGIEAVFTIKRGEFGMTYGAGGIGNDVRLMFGLEGAAQ